MPVVWVVAQARYRDTKTGRFISQATVIEYVKASIDASVGMFKSLGEQVSQGILSKTAFSTAFRQEIKDETIRQYVAGRGGIGSMTQADWGRVGRLIREQYKYAAKFESALGDLSEAAIVNRASLYAQATGAAFEYGHKAAIIVSGKFKEEFWELGDAEHCSDCVDLNAKGWVPIGDLGTVPRAGATACMVNCQCNLKYR